MDFRAARGIADAVFYEGYLLYPYTATSSKNKLRWQFGVVVPKAAEAAGTGEHAHQQTEVLFECGANAQIELLFRFLQVQARTVEARTGDAFTPVVSLTVGGTAHLAFDESIEREVAATYRPVAGAPASVPFAFGGARNVEDLRDADGAVVGRVVRERWPVTGRLSLEATLIANVRPPLAAAASADRTVWRLRVRAENASDVVAASERGVVVRTAFVSAHTLLAITDGAFWSPIDAPEPALAARASAVNEHTWPVLVGNPHADEQRAPMLLSSPIVLADFPQIAAQTNADAFDGTEIDELLNLSVLSLSDAERAEARATDPRARAIIERAEAFDAADLARTHAECETVGQPAPVGPRRRDEFYAVPVFGGSDQPDAAPASVRVGGVTVSKGSSVRLAPKRRADAWDMFLAGKIATVQAIHQDFEDKLYVAVTVDDDPATEYHQWYGRSFFFEPDEVEPVGVPG
jgi:hypothetical protein